MRIFKAGSNTLKNVQLYGERNSGTSYLANLLRDGLASGGRLYGSGKGKIENRFGYKHWFVSEDNFDDSGADETLFIVIYRNPYTWLRAMLDRPYALSDSISGKEVFELPEVMLTGRVNGKETSNEFHPITGDQVNIFELRRLKIEGWEALRGLVKNVAFVNMEELLQSPCYFMQRLNSVFGSLFCELPEAGIRQPPKQLFYEYSRPTPFSNDEMKIIDQNLDWSIERKIGYARGDYSVTGAE